MTKISQSIPSTTEGQRIGYGRVSTRDQHPESQHDALTASGVDRLYVEQFTGTKASRPEFDKLRDHIRGGDTLVVTRLDRLGRSTKDLLNIAADLEEHGVNLEVIEQSIDTTTPEGRLFFRMIAAFAEFEHDLMTARTLDGLAAARARGRNGGRRSKLTPAKVAEVRKLYAARDKSVQEIADLFDVSRQTIYRAVDTSSTPASR